MKKYILSQMVQVSAWIGLAILLGAFALPRDWIAIMGLALMLTDDAWLKGKISRAAPSVQRTFDEMTK